MAQWVPSRYDLVMASQSVAMNVPLSATQRRVLVAVKRRGEATADELAEALEISPSAVRQHLSALRSAGLIEARQVRGQPGRPADVHHATERAEALFVAPDDRLSVDLLDQVAEEDPEIVDRVFERRRRRLVAEANEQLAGLGLGGRITRLTELLEEQGYLADCERVDHDRYRINLHSCAVWSVASRYRQACSEELEFLRDLVPGATVERVSLKTAGAHTCAYEIHDAGG